MQNIFPEAIAGEADPWDIPKPDNLYSISTKLIDSSLEAVTKVEHATKPLIVISRQANIRLDSHNACI